MAQYTESFNPITQYDIGYHDGVKMGMQTIIQEVEKEIFNYLKVTSREELENLSLLDSTMTYDVVTDKLDELTKQYRLDKEN